MIALGDAFIEAPLRWKPGSEGGPLGEETLLDAHPPRVTTSRTARADFLEDSQDIDHVSQDGNFKYNEGDRNAVAERAVYDGQKQCLSLRGKRPMAWDEQAEAGASNDVVIEWWRTGRPNSGCCSWRPGSPWCRA